MGNEQPMGRWNVAEPGTTNARRGKRLKSRPGRCDRAAGPVKGLGVRGLTWGGYLAGEHDSGC